jgi:hypothetical protein
MEVNCLCYSLTGKRKVPLLSERKREREKERKKEGKKEGRKIPS